MQSKLRMTALGIELALVSILALHRPLAGTAPNGLALFLSLTACVYPGALLARAAGRGATLAELAVAGAVFAAAWLGLVVTVDRGRLNGPRGVGLCCTKEGGSGRGRRRGSRRSAQPSTSRSPAK